MSHPTTSSLASDTPRLAILIPIFRHPSLLLEAVESVLAQRFDHGLRLLLVSDGCPLPETDQVCRDYAAAYPDVITYLRKANGGLSDARNHGIRHVLAHLPTVEAIYMLDADNRLRPDAMARAVAALDADDRVDWVYPNIDMFGLNSTHDYGGDYSLLVHSELNICEAGSLIRRRVFDSGVLFDTSFKLGWEDWDFFLTAARRGFRGRNIEDFGFQYRKRPESMLADSGRDHFALTGAMGQKHKPLYAPRSLLQLEQVEAPRYAIHIADSNEVMLCVDPATPGTRRVPFDEFERMYWQSLITPGSNRTPPFNVVMTSAVLSGLQQSGLLHWALWKLETICDGGNIAALTVHQSAEGHRLAATVKKKTPLKSDHREAIAIALPAKLLSEILRDPNSEWIDSLAEREVKPPIATLALQVPHSTAIACGPRQPSAIFDTLALVHRMRASPWRQAASVTWGFRQHDIVNRGREHLIVRQRCGDAAVLPRLPDGRRHIGFLLPLVEFGGVEKVALKMAMGLRSHGWVPHAFVVQAQDISLTPEWAETFETTNLLLSKDFSAWGAASQSYLGTDVSNWAMSGKHGPMLGMLHWLDAVVNCHGGAAAGVMGQLRRMGIKTLNSLHLNDLTPLGRPSGNTYLGLAYEHAFDMFVPCSHQLGDWLHGMGVPRDKIVPVQNAPGFDIDADITAQGVEQRFARDDGEPLRVLYMGRLDRQKGLDRLAEVMRQTAGLGLDWRIVGKAVITNDSAALAPEITAALEPPLSRPSELAEAYAWADVLILPSRFEGLPLTVLEAMRAGAVVLATDVGATGEVLRNGVNGILVPDDCAVSGCVAALVALAADRTLLRRLSARALSDQEGHDWIEATRELANRLG